MHEWTTETLWNKARAYIERAFQSDRNSEFFPFFASLGLEFLARAALAKVHPALLADPQDGGNIMYAFGFPATDRPQSVPAKTVYVRLAFLIEDFNEQDKAACLLLADGRNREVHTGVRAFLDFPTGKWLPDYYRVASKIVAYLGHDLSDLFGVEEAEAIRDIIHDVEEKIVKEVRARVGGLKAKIAGLTEAELNARRAEKQPKFIYSISTSGVGSFRRACPTCTSYGVLTATPVGSIPPSLKGGDLIAQKILAAKEFTCGVCALELKGTQELRVVDLGDQITVDDEVDPVEYFSSRFDEALQEHVDRYEPDPDDMVEYGND